MDNITVSPIVSKMKWLILWIFLLLIVMIEALPTEAPVDEPEFITKYAYVRDCDYAKSKSVLL